MLAIITIGAATLAGCAPSAPPDPDGSSEPTEASVALINEFFAHLEAGETAEAADLTSIDFPEDTLDEDFYRASVALPSNATVVTMKGSDEHTVWATVEYVLGDPDTPVTASFKVKNTDGERRLTWENDGKVSFINVGSPGRLVVNGEIEAPNSTTATSTTLLPALYDVTWVDPTGTTQLDADGINAFALPVPYETNGASTRIPGFDLPDKVHASSSSVSVSAFVTKDVVDPADDEIKRLQDACVAELLIGPSCPDILLEYPYTVDGSEPIEWFRDSVPGYGLEIADGSVGYSAGFNLRVDGKVFPVPVVYEGHITRDDDGTVTFTRK